METIVKIFTGKYIDLTKIVAITDAEFIDRMGYGGYYVGFTIYCQLLEKPIVYERKLDYREEKYENGKIHAKTNDRNGKILAEENLQKQVDEIVSMWKNVMGSD